MKGCLNGCLVILLVFFGFAIVAIVVPNLVITKETLEKVENAKIAEETRLANRTPKEIESDLIVDKQKQIENDISWDNSYRPLVKLVKDNMNDPDSFQHVETKYWKSPKTFVFKMIYRGKNVFGGVVTQKIRLEIDLKNNTMKTTEEE